MFGNPHTLVFSRGNLSEIFQRVLSSISSKIENETEDYILNVNETELIDHLESENRLTFPQIHHDQVSVDSYEGDVPAEHFPRDYDIQRNLKYKRQIIRYHIPCSGRTDLLPYSPSTMVYFGSRAHFFIQGSSLVLDIINFSNETEKIKDTYTHELNTLLGTYRALNKEVEDFNSSLNSFISTSFKRRKDKLLAKNNLLASLGVPLKKNDNASATFSVPKPQLRERIIIKPTVTEVGYKSEPTLDEANYQKILKLINDVGKNFERLPSVYKDKGEEDLRDHILMVLDPNFELGSASGETFNKSGKTDIQLRYESSVVFISECKFWNGESALLATIDQLLRYLTWRDTKASLIIFVKQKNFSSILEKVEIITPKHCNYLGYLGKSDENWFNYRFHINDDSNREVKLAIQLYHMPDIN